MKRGRRKGGSKDKVFGCDLMEHLSATSQEIPHVLRSCSEFIEEYGIVDGIYRLSGVSSNTQKLRSEFDTEGYPDLYKDVYLQDIHCVSSLCKAYFRELPNPLLTYQLYDHFAEAVSVQLEDERLVKIKDVLQELPRPHYKTLEYLMRHLVKMATYSGQTNMHARNLAIVWAPNLLRSKDIEASGFNGTAAFMEVRVQSIVVEFILTHVPQLFPEPNSEPGYTSERRKSLPSPTIQSGQDDPFHRSSPFQCPGNMSPGDGPPPMRPYHAIIDGTDKRKGSLKGRKWKSIFNLGGRLQDPRKKNKYALKDKEKTSLRPAKSMDSLSSGPYIPEDSRQPSTHLSPVPVSSGNAEGMAPGTGGVGSGYAVTYRRTGGASVSVVSGGSGAHGTYKSLDPGGPASSEKSQSPSQVSASKAERRAGMHISGPFSVTVPLHITSGLALGVLQGGRAEEEQLTSQVPEEEESKKVNKESFEEKDPDVEGASGQTDRETGGLGDNEDSTGEKEEKNMKSEEIEETGPEEREESEDEDIDYVSEEEEPDNRLHADRPSISEDQDGGDYMVMRPTMLPCPVEDQNKELSPLSPEEKYPDQELPLDFQDTFGFLDLMDTSASNQVYEFSVEPPAFEDEEEEEDKQSPQSKCHSAQTSPNQSDMITPLLDLPANLHRLVPGKSHSLPYKSCPFQPVLSSDDDDDDDIDYSGPEYEGDSESEKSEYEDMFYKSLPSESHFHGLNWSCSPTTSSHDQSENSNLIPTIEVQVDIPELPSGDQVENSETKIHTEIIVKDAAGACITDQSLNEANLSPLPLDTECLLSTEHLDEKMDKENEDKSTKDEEEFESFEVGFVNRPTEEENNGFWSTDGIEVTLTCSNNETLSMECENQEDSFFDPNITSISVEPNTMGTSWMGEQPPLTEEHARSHGQQEITEGYVDVSESDDKLINAVDCVFGVIEDNVETGLEGQTDSSELGGVSSELGEEERDERNMVEEMNEESSEVEMDDERLPEAAEANVEKVKDVDVQKDETGLERREEDREDLTIEMQKEGRNTGKESDREIEEDDIVEETEVKNDLEDATEIKEGSVPQEAKEEEMSEEDRISENEQQDSTEVHPDEKGKVEEYKHEEISENKKSMNPPIIKDIGPGMGRTVVISKNTPPKVYQAKSVPVVPPKPQHSKITAFKQQFQQRDIEKQLISIHYFERGFAKKEKETEHQEHTNIEEGDIGRNNHQNTEQEKKSQENVAVRVKKQRKETKPCHSFGGERQENKEDLRQRRGTWDGGCRRKDVQKDLDRETKRTSGISICFDEAVARASGKLCREKETTEKDRLIDLHWEKGERKEGLNERKMEKEVKTD